MPTTFEKTWQTALNVTPSDNATVLGLSRSYLWFVKAFLKGEVGGATAGLWTCVGSSDSVTAGMDGTDRWGATYDGTKIVRASGAVAHSWIVLKSPNFTAGGIAAVPFYMILQYNGTLDYQAIFIFSKAAPTGGSITARPTATDEWVHTAAQGQINDNTAAAYTFDGWLATDGNFALGAAKTTTGMMYVAQMFHVLSNANANDLYPACSFVAYSATQPGGWNQTSQIWRGRTFNGASAFAAGTMAWAKNQSDPTGMAQANGDVTINKYLRLPTWMFVTDAGLQSFRGRFADLVIAAPSGIGVQGLVEPTSGAPVSTILGFLWFPVNGVAVAL
jgi:hypothetical protein